MSIPKAEFVEYHIIEGKEGAWRKLRNAGANLTPTKPNGVIAVEDYGDGKQRLAEFVPVDPADAERAK